jgi:hypothetical protein
VLDRVRCGLVAGEDDVVPLLIAGLALSQPVSQGAAKRSERGGLGRHRELEALGRELDRAEGEQGDVVLRAGAEPREQAVAELLEIHPVLVAHRRRKSCQALVNRLAPFLDQPVRVEQKR